MESKNFKSSSKVLSNKKKKIILSKLERKKKLNNYSFLLLVLKELFLFIENYKLSFFSLLNNFCSLKIFKINFMPFK